MDIATIEQIFRRHSRGNDEVTLNDWLSYSTLCRYRDWVPRPQEGEATLVDIGCYQPSIGYYFELGWRHVVGIAKEEGEVVAASTYTSGAKQAEILIMDVEKEKIPLEDESVDTVLMMEIFEHFALDPMHAVVEANRILRSNGRLVFSTPNAASWKNLHRIAAGRCPFVNLEFSGFSTNRHNRLYDRYEMEGIFESAGFEVTLCSSRSYSTAKPSLEERVLRELLHVLDRWRSRRSSRRVPEREDFLFLVAEKTGLPKERYPRSLYFDVNAWPSWYRTIERLDADTAPLSR